MTNLRQPSWIPVEPVSFVLPKNNPSEYDALAKNLPLPKGSKIACFQPFMEGNLIRLGGRLQFTNASADEIHPLLLDGAHPFSSLLIKHTHVRLHHLGTRIVLSELISLFWILRA